MRRSITSGPARDIVYYSVLAGISIALTRLFYLQLNGLI